jgi:hypothetical protein
MNPNNDPNLFNNTKVYLIQSTSDDVIPYITNPRSGVDFHPTSAKGHSLKDSDYFDSFEFLLMGTKKYTPTAQEKAVLEMIKVEDVKNLGQASAILATNVVGTPEDVKAELEQKLAKASDHVDEDASDFAPKGPGLKENGEALTKEEVEEIQESMEASGEFVMAKAILR